MSPSAILPLTPSSIHELRKLGGAMLAIVFSHLDRIGALASMSVKQSPPCIATAAL
jgi:hypothetical protein